MFFSRSIFFRLFVSFLIILVLPMLLVGGVSYYNTLKLVERQFQETNALMAGNIREAYDSVFKNMDSIIFFINSMPWIHKIIKQDQRVDDDSLEVDEIKSLTSQIAVYRLNVKQIEEIAVIFNNADMVFSSNGFSSIPDYFSQYSFTHEEFNGYADIQWDEKKQIILSHCLVSKYKAPAVERMILLQNLPINDAAQFRACILIQVNLEKMTDIFDSFEMENKTVVQIADSGNKLLLSSDDSFPPTIERMASGGSPEQNGSTVVGSEEYAYSYTSSAYNGFKYLMLADRGGVNSKTGYVKWFTGILTLASLLLGLLLSYAAARRNYKPMQSMIERIFPGALTEHGQKVDEMRLIETAVNNLSIQNHVMQKRMEDDLPVLKNNLIYRLINGTASEEELQAHLDTCGIKPDRPFFTVISMEVDAMARLSADESQCREMPGMLLTRHIEKYFKDKGDICLVMSTGPFAYVMLLNTSGESYLEVKGKLRALVGQIREMLKDRYEIAAASGIGGMHSSLYSASSAYKEARSALDCKFVVVDPEAVCYDEIKETKQGTAFSFRGMEQQLLNLLKNGDCRKVEKYLHEWFEGEMGAGGINFDSGVYIFHTMLFIAAKALDDAGENYTDYVDFKAIGEFKSMYDTQRYVEELFYKVCDIISEKKGKADGSVIEKIIQYLDSHYRQKDLSLTMLSEEFGLSNAYLSFLIKENLGKNFLNYVNLKRMDQAERLLKDVDFPLKDIPAAVGFENGTNFRRVFKKHFAVTPGEYRNNWIKCKK